MLHLSPIVERELRVAARRRRLHRERVVISLVVAVVGGWGLAASVQLGMGRPAAMTFGSLSYVALIVCLFSGARLTSDCISSEKREDTLGLLFLTRLSSAEIVLGKLTAGCLHAFQSLLAVLPVLALFLVFGGVSRMQIFETSCLLVNTLFFSAAIGILVSTVGRKQRSNEHLCVVILLIFWLGLPNLAALLPQTNPPSKLLSAGVKAIAPFPVGQGFGGSQVNVWWSLFITHVVGWLLLFCSIRLLPRLRIERPKAGLKTRLQEKWRQFTLGSGERRAEFRRRALEQNPIYWLLARSRFKHFRLWLFVGAVSVLLGGIVAAPAIVSGSSPPGLALWFLLLAGAAVWYVTFKLMIADEASRPLAVERSSGTLELILATPISEDRLLQGLRIHLWRLFRLPMAGLLAAVIAIIAVSSISRGLPLASPELAAAAFAMMIVFVADYATFRWVGPWVALTAKRHRDCPNQTSSYVLALPTLIFIVFVAAQLLWANLSSGRPLGFFTYLLIWLVIALLTDWFLSRMFSRILRRRLRKLAGQPMAGASPRRTWWFSRRPATDAGNHPWTAGGGSDHRAHRE